MDDRTRYRVFLSGHVRSLICVHSLPYLELAVQSRKKRKDSGHRRIRYGVDDLITLY